MLTKPLSYCFALAVALGANDALALSINAQEAINAFNLIVFNDLDSTSEVEGRTYVGGDLSGTSSTYFTRADQVPDADVDALIVGGDVVGGFKNINGGGDASVGGNVQNMNMNGGTARIAGQVTGNVNGNKQIGASVLIPELESSLLALSRDLSLLDGVDPVIQGKRGVFDFDPAANLAVYTIANGGAFFDSINEISLSLSIAETVIINVAGATINIQANFLGGPFAAAPYVLWNFHEATELNLHTQFFGTVLAPTATVSNITPIEGTLVAGNFMQRGEIHNQPFTGNLPTPPTGTPVPTPGSLALLGCGLLGLGWGRRRHC